MRTRNKRIWQAMAVALGVIAGAWFWWGWLPAAAPQIITLASGEKFQFAGVTYGRRIVPPSLGAQYMSRLPGGLANWLKPLFGNSISQYNGGGYYESPRLFVWFRSLETNSSSAGVTQIFSAMLAVQNGTEGGAQGGIVFSSGVTWSYAAFPVFPRRSRILVCNFYSTSGDRRNATRMANISFPNPLLGIFPPGRPSPCRRSGSRAT